MARVVHVGPSGQWCADQARNDADDARDDQGLDDSAPQKQDKHRGGGEDAELPHLAQRASQRYGSTENRADRGRPRPVEERDRGRIPAYGRERPRRA